MFVITADQVNSRNDVDRVPDVLAGLDDILPRLAVAPGRFAGDELQFVTADAATALELVLRLTRSEHWSVGVGVGRVREPLPADVAAASGSAFIRAREGIGAAKRSATRFALSGPDQLSPSADDIGAMVDLLLVLRARRSDEGWEVVDLMTTGAAQIVAAERLGISPQAVSLRLRTAGWRIEERARRGLVVLLQALDRSAVEHDEESPAPRVTDDIGEAG